MKFGIPIVAAALLSLAFVPVASANVGEPQVAADTCILYPWSVSVGGYGVYTPPVVIQGQNVKVLFLEVTTQTVTVTSFGVWVPYVTTVYTPGICWDDVSRLISEFADVTTLA